MANGKATILQAALAATTLAVPVACTRYLPSESPSLQPRKVQRALVLWFSQTGNTARIGRLMAAVWKQRGVAVDAAELRDFDPASIGGYDLVAMGSPVNHYDLPDYVKGWLKKLPPLSGVPVAAFVTHGIPESNSHNTACSLLDLLAQNGAVPMGLATFGNLGTYPPYWAFYPDKAVSGSAYPNGDTFAKALQYATALIDGVEAGAAYSYRYEIGLGDVKKNLAPIWFSKLITDAHTIDKERCTGCGTWLLARDIRKFTTCADPVCALFMGTDKVLILKVRPCLIISPDEMNRHIRTVIAAPLTTVGKAYPSRVFCEFLGLFAIVFGCQESIRTPESILAKSPRNGRDRGGIRSFTRHCPRM